ncbi:CREB-binding protein-like [Notechis scutatus]|uniref:histone acetyltransferase n=1 Tax=Notechis scutatus TaxID=8663 RepID=A0A6J1VP76_9SAUR|nr:CREB-binding protein-like [Notechis scutatus]
MMQGQVMDGSIGAGRGYSNMSSPNPGMGNAGILMAETSQQGSPQMGGQASLRGPQPGAMNKDDDLGIARNNTEDHEHKMEKRGLGMDNGSNNQQAAAIQSPADSRRLSIQRCIQSLIHACQCRNANCSVPSCQKMKKVVQHTKRCKRKISGGCPVCKQLVALCCYHAKHCQENKCLVPLCLNIKRKLRQQELQHRLRQAQILRRRMKAPAGG